MKKKIFIYSSVAACLLTLVTLINYFSYNSAMEEFKKETNSRQHEWEEDFSILNQKMEKLEKKQKVKVTETDSKLTVDTIYEIQTYDAKKGQNQTSYEILPEELIGLNRQETEAYFKKYMDNLPVEEFLNGLQSVGVVSFSKARLSVKKMYDITKVKYRYYLIAVDGEVVVYYGDKKTVFEYSGIKTENLSSVDQDKLKNGIEIKDEDELFGILQNYSS